MKALSSPAHKRYRDDPIPGTGSAGKSSAAARVYGGLNGTDSEQPAREDTAVPDNVVQLAPAATSEPAAAGDSEVEASETEDKPGWLRRLGRSITGGLKEGGSLLAKGVASLYGLGLDGVHWVADKGSQGLDAVGDGAEWLGDTIGADTEGVLGLPGRAVRGLGGGLKSGAGGVRDTFGLDEDGNDFTGHVDIPKDNDEHTQQYSELGLPMTEDAWAMQDAIDGGKLRETYNQTLLSSLQEGGVLERLVAEGTISRETIPASFEQMPPDQFNALIDAVRTELGSGRAFLDSLEPDEREAFQEQVVYAYMARAKGDDRAAFMLELMPTDTSNIPGQMGAAAGDALLRGQGANEFKVGEYVGRIRQGAVTMSERLQATGDNVYALPVPYANTVPNIVGRNATPSDGADHLHNYLEHLGPDMKTATTGYSQGGAAVLDYVARYGDQDGLDYALALAPMGGADQYGGDGVYSGEFNGVSTLSIMNDKDPAKDLYGDYLVDLIGPMRTFVSADRQAERGLDGALHGGHYGDEDHPLPAGSDPRAAMAAGTLGYPTGYVSPMLDDLFAGRHSGTPFGRRGDWGFDLRDELLHNGQNG
ncbi:MAG: hypothetical protein AAGC55_08785, partial [Myxococcota bacterium]